MTSYINSSCIEGYKNVSTELIVSRELAAQESRNATSTRTNNKNITKYLARLGYIQRLVLCCSLHYCQGVITATCVCSCIMMLLKERGIRFEEVFDSWDQCRYRIKDAIQRLSGKGRSRSEKPKILLPVKGGYTLAPIYEDLLDTSICNDAINDLLKYRKYRTHIFQSNALPHEADKLTDLLRMPCADGDSYLECLYKLYDLVFEDKADLIRIGHSNARNMIQELRYLFFKGYLMLEVAQWLAHQRIDIGEVSVREVRNLEKNR